jgi:hypothetical protein
MAMAMAMASVTAKKMSRAAKMGFRLLSKAGRLASIALLLVGAAYSSQTAVKSYLREADAKAAYSAYPTDGLAAVNAFAAELKTDPLYIISSHDAGAARASLVNRPLNASLLSFYGLRAASTGNVGQASVLMASADAVSRRDALSQLWMIEQTSNADDVNGAVAHYNALLSVHPAMQAAFLPVLVSAVAYPEVRRAIRPYLTPETGWSARFLDMASQRVEVGQYRDLAAPIASRLRGDEYAVSNARIIYRMLQSGLAGDAWKLLTLFAPDVDVATFRAFAPGGPNLDPKWQPLSWVLGQSNDISASVSGDGAIDVTVAPTARGLIASRDVAVISSSTYFLGHRSMCEPGPPCAALRWSVYCAAQNRLQLIVDRFVPADANSKLVQLSVDVPENCNLVRVELSTLASEGQFSSIFKITDLTFAEKN